MADASPRGLARRIRTDPPLEPWDYWYFGGCREPRSSLPAIPRESLLPHQQALLPGSRRRPRRDSGCSHDLDVRPGKAPLAYTDQVRIGRRSTACWRPALPRVSANYEQGGLFVLNELIHEDGHAVHDAALRTRPAFYSLGDDLFLEAFADVPAWSSFEPRWQRKYLGHSAPAAASLERAVLERHAGCGLGSVRICAC